jgi:hypothetical protein
MPPPRHAGPVSRGPYDRLDGAPAVVTRSRKRTWTPPRGSSVTALPRPPRARPRKLFHRWRVPAGLLVKTAWARASLRASKYATQPNASRPKCAAFAQLFDCRSLAGGATVAAGSKRSRVFVAPDRQVDHPCIGGELPGVHGRVARGCALRPMVLSSNAPGPALDTGLRAACRCSQHRDHCSCRG